MGGEGSGRKPSIDTIMKRGQPDLTPIGDSLFLPNYSGVQTAALKTEAPLSTGGGGSQWTSGSNNIFPISKLTISGSGFTTSGTISGGAVVNYISGTSTTPTTHINQGAGGDAATMFSIIGDSYAIGIDNSDSDKFKISYSGSAGKAILGVQDRFVVDSAGNIGLGTSAPSFNLDIRGANTEDPGTISLGNSDVSNFYVFDSGRATDDWARMFFSKSNTTTDAGFSIAKSLSNTTGAIDMFIIMVSGSFGITSGVGTGHLGFRPADLMHLSGGAMIIEDKNGVPATYSKGGKIYVSGGELWFVGGGGTNTKIAGARRK